jgi:hypothetical protein
MRAFPSVFVFKVLKNETNKQKNKNMALKLPSIRLLQYKEIDR